MTHPTDPVMAIAQALHMHDRKTGQASETVGWMMLTAFDQERYIAAARAAERGRIEAYCTEHGIARGD